MTRERTPAPRSRSLARDPAGAPARRRWPLAVAALTLVAAGAYYVIGQAEPRSPPAPVPPAGDTRSEPSASVPERRVARPAQQARSPASPRRAAPSAEPSLEAPSELPEEAEALDSPEAPPDDPHAQRAAVPRAAAPPSESAEEAPREAAAERPSRAKPRPRRLELTQLRRWRQAGLCARAEQATEAQRTLMSHFRAAELAAGARVYLDPRLSAGAEAAALGYLEEAQRILQAELQLSPGLPDVFLYQDVQLLLASACTNADVVAYYDGALHVVVTRDDVRESVLHEFTHHALMTAGVIGPAWLQEGMAMHIARETWWRRPELLQRLLDRPFGLTTMETLVPYTLENDQAALFYVQAAAMVECTTREPDSTLSGLLSELDVQQSGETLDYGLPALAELSALRACVRELLQEGAAPSGRAAE